MTRQMRHRAAAIGVVVLSGALALAGCGGSTSKPKSSSSTGSGGVQTGGTLKFATDATYAPNEFVKGGQIVGMDVDLGNAIAKQLGKTATWSNVTFNNIIPALASKKYDVGMSSFTITKEREQTVNFVSYFSAGEALVTPNGNPKNLSTSDTSLCGHKVAVEAGTTEESDLKSGGLIATRCKTGGKAAPLVVSFDNQDQVNLALSSGRADGMLLDSPVADYEVQQSAGKFQISGAVYGQAPYGIALPKDDSALSNSVLQAMQALISNGTYKQILTKWNLTDGAITSAALNPPAS